MKLQSRGVDIYRLTLGEIIYMENEAATRDQILYACSAQNAALLPKVKLNKKQAAEKIKSIVQAQFDAFRMDKENQQ